MSKIQFTGAVVCATVFLGFLAYANTFTGEWVWDDASSVLSHEHVHQPSKLLQLFGEDQHAFGRGQGNFYRPLVSASFMLDFWLTFDPIIDSGEHTGVPAVKPFLFHLTNLFWHLSAAILLFFLLARLQAPRIIQAVTPLLFVLHPMHTEAVAYISGRADMMSATFLLAALLCASINGNGRIRLAGLIGSGLFFVLGLCSKESTMIYPVLLALLIGLRPQPDGTAPTKAVWKARSLPLIVAVAILVGYGALRATVLKFSEGGGASGTGLGQRMIETCQAFAFYLKTLFIPTRLHMEQTLAGTPIWTAVLGLLGLALIVALMVWAFRKGHRRIALGFAWFLAAWLPISGLFPLNAPMAEHWMYVPMAGFWWATLELMLLASRRVGVGLLVPALATVLAMAFLYGTVQRNRDWHDNEAIFRATLAENPETMRVHFNLATTYEYFEGNLPGARRHYEKVLALLGPGATSQSIETKASLAEVLLRQGAYQEALNHFIPLTGLAKQPEFKTDAAKATLGVGQCYLALGNYGRATQAIQQAIALDPALAPQGIGLLRGAPLPKN